MGNTYGYARVSSRDQNLDRQLDALAEFGVETRRVFADKASGKDFERPEWRRMLRRLRAGDVLVVKSIDRLGRNYDEIIDQWRHVTKEKGVAVVVLDMPLLDTREKPNNITGTFIADLVLQLLSYVAQGEARLLQRRQGAREGAGIRHYPRGPDRRGARCRLVLVDDVGLDALQGRKAINIWKYSIGVHLGRGE